MKLMMSDALLVAGLVPATFCWMEFAYRLSLYRRYGSQPFLNHVADGYFEVMYSVAGVAIILFVIGMLLAVRRKLAVRAIVYSFAAVLCVCFAAALCFIHQRDILVTYGEFVKNLGP